VLCCTVTLKGWQDLVLNKGRVVKKRRKHISLVAGNRKIAIKLHPFGS